MQPIAYTKDGRPIMGPQEGPQTQMIQSSADIVIGGGAAGGGKSVWLILEGAKHAHVPDFTGVIFRRQYNEIVDPGGLWDTSIDMYKAIGGDGTRGKTRWEFPAESTIKMNHLNKESNKTNHQGLAYTYLSFDELTHFSRSQFFYLLTRNRNFGTCTVRPYCRASCNPDADSWVAEFISWWWHPDTGYPIPERQGIIRHFVRDTETDDILWVSQDYRDKYGNAPKSMTFIASKLEDNKLMPNLEQYRAGIMSNDRVTRERLSLGNWLISYSGGMFDPSWFEIVDEAPAGIKWLRYWDLAATEEDEEKAKDPDWTAGGKVGIVDGVLYISDMKTMRETPGRCEIIMKQTAQEDTRDTDIAWEEEKGAGGKYTTEYLLQVFKGYNAKADPVEAKKVERAAKWAAWAEFGRVKLVRGEWNKQFLARAGKFPFGKKDEIDAISGGFKVLVGPKLVVEYYNPRNHMINFNKDRSEFDKIQPRNVDIYIGLWVDETGGIYGGCYLWTHIKRKLKQYAEIFQPHPIPRLLAEEIREKAIVDITSKSGYVTVRKIYCNERMAKKGKTNILKELRRVGIRAHEATLYNEQGTIFRVNRMFAEGTLSIHDDCIETDVQLRRMAYDKNKLPSVGYPLVRSLFLVEAQIRGEVRKIEEKTTVKPYSKKKMDIRDQLRMTKKLDEQKNEHDWLAT